MAVPALRAEVLSLCDELQGIYAFNYQYSPPTRKLLDSIRDQTPIAPARWLREHRDRLREAVNVGVV